MQDPRFDTVYSEKSVPNPKIIHIPFYVKEEWCEPGYQPKRPNKGIALTVNDYPYHNVKYNNPSWKNVVCQK